MTTRIPPLNPQILEEAAAWFIDFTEEEVDQRGREEFNAWLRRSPEHVRAFLQVSGFWEDADKLAKRPDFDLEALIEHAKAESNVHALEFGGRERGPDRDSLTVPQQVASRAPGRVKRFWLASAAAVVACVISGISWYALYRGPTYATEIGEQRSLTLEDGSTVELNSLSRIRVRFSDGERLVDLLEGQALFTVAKNPSRPFIVTTADMQVRAVGTQFDVYRKSAGTLVTVVEGRVAVAAHEKDASGGNASSPHPEAGAPIIEPGEVLLAAGEQLMVTPVAVEPPKPADIAVAIAWTDKRLVFESTPLREVVEEFNRYNRRKLVIRDPELYDFHVSGVFPSADLSRMVKFLRQRFGVTLNSSRDQIEISRPGGGETSPGEGPGAATLPSRDE